MITFLINCKVYFHGLSERLRHRILKGTSSLRQYLSGVLLLCRGHVLWKRPDKTLENTPHPHKISGPRPHSEIKTMSNEKSMIIVETPTEVAIQPYDWAPFANSFAYRYRYCARSGRGEFQDGYGRLLEVCPLEVDEMIRICTKAISRRKAIGFVLVEQEDEELSTLGESAFGDFADYDEEDVLPLNRRMTWHIRAKSRQLPLCDSQYDTHEIIERTTRPTCFEDDQLPILHMGVDILKSDDEYLVEDRDQLTWAKHLPTGMCFEFATKLDRFVRFAGDEKNTPTRKMLGYET